ncbi:MAG: hypothetical protein L3J41_00335 [Melioribacteraceae bacterium]|nr:hypothetical protein [Melioribacteraceae bacterium]
MKILDISNDRLIDVEIVISDIVDVPSKNDGWNFDWQELKSEPGTKTYALKMKGNKSSIEGMLHLKIAHGMQVMDIIEIAPHNIGSQNKKYDHVAGSLIAFACRESFKLENEYKGYLTFVSKSKLIEWYIKKYGAEQAVGQKMFIEPEISIKLIDKYLNNKGE